MPAPRACGPARMMPRWGTPSAARWLRAGVARETRDHRGGLELGLVDEDELVGLGARAPLARAAARHVSVVAGRPWAQVSAWVLLRPATHGTV